MSAPKRKPSHVFETGQSALSLLTALVERDPRAAARVINEAPCQHCLNHALAGLLMSMEPWGSDGADRAWMTDAIIYARARLEHYHRALS